MKRQVSSEQLSEAFLKAKLGTEHSYPVWTPLWGLRAKIWQDKSLRKVARNSLGDIAIEAIDDGDPGLLRDLAAALEKMLEFERDPANALRADVYFAIEEMNDTVGKFTRGKLLKWLNREMEAIVTKEELARTLEEMGLDEAIPAG
ncbi:MAG: hypothetical protein HKN82_04440 [Akkermansiaceae bacterium]|nr:hypothetical protein [Akkermansiaceae bacterium]NNM28034.1 hypothetical protein [Akkermansiaceae bacterium]